MNELPPRVEHLIIQLGDATPPVLVTSSETEHQHRDSDCIPAHGVFGDRVILKIQSSRYVGEARVHFERVCE